MKDKKFGFAEKNLKKYQIFFKKGFTKCSFYDIIISCQHGADK